MVWSSEQIKELTQLWLSGMSAGDISRKLNISKNAIIGKIHRLNLPQRPSPIIKKQDEHTECNLINKNNKQKQEETLRTLSQPIRTNNKENEIRLWLSGLSSRKLNISKKLA